MAEGERTCCWDGNGCFNSNVEGDDNDVDGDENGETYDDDDSGGEEGGGRRRRHGKL